MRNATDAMKYSEAKRTFDSFGNGGGPPQFGNQAHIDAYKLLQAREDLRKVNPEIEDRDIGHYDLIEFRYRITTERERQRRGVA